MKDFPVFTTENGVASLILKEVPYRGEAYIHLRDSQDPKALLEECVSFCAACGAEKPNLPTRRASPPRREANIPKEVGLPPT